VDLEGEPIDDLGRLGQPTMLRTLNLSSCQLASISGLKFLPQLETFIADGSQILTFTNFAAIENVRRLSLRNTPLARVPRFNLSAVVVCPRVTSPIASSRSFRRELVHIRFSLAYRGSRICLG
jgi:Leucine-rich repeat (LRR) protein